MGYSSYRDDLYQSVTTARSNKSIDQVFVNKTVAKTMNTLDIKLRESRDSDAHPRSTAVSLWLDVTGSMGQIADVLARKGAGLIMRELLDKKPVSDPQLLVGAFDDFYCCSTPLQVGQYEAGLEIDDWLTNICLTKNGGGNHRESYLLSWYFLTHYTSLDCVEKRQEKAFCFSVGDEAPYNEVSSKELAVAFGKDLETVSAKDLLIQLQKTHHVFHIIISEGLEGKTPNTINSWRNLLGENVLICDDHTKIAELIVTAIGQTQGLDQDIIVQGFDAKTTSMVLAATSKLARANTSSDLIRF